MLDAGEQTLRSDWTKVKQEPMLQVDKKCRPTRHALSYDWYSVYTIQPVVKPVVQPVGQPAASRKQTSSRLSHHTGLTTGRILFTRCSRLSNRLYSWTAGCTTGLTTGWMFVYTIQPVVQPVVKPVWQLLDNRLHRVNGVWQRHCHETEPRRRDVKNMSR